MESSYHKFWGKAGKSVESVPVSYHLLVYHLLDAAAVSYLLLERDSVLCRRMSGLCGMNSRDFQVWFTFLMGLHDIGKFSQQFQYLREDILCNHSLYPELEKRGAYNCGRHDSLGQLLWEKKLCAYVRSLSDPHVSPLFQNIWNSHYKNNILSMWTYPIMGHHGKPPVSIDRDFHYCFVDKSIEAAESFAADWLKLLSGFEFPCKPISIDAEPFMSWNMAGLAVLCDWLGSSAHFSYQSVPIPLDEYWRSYALPTANNAIEYSGVLPKPVQTRIYSTNSLFSYDKPSPLQKWAEDFEAKNSQYLIIIEDVTGSGKTEASILAVNRLMANGLSDGLYFALPTMATANAMYGRLESQYQSLFEAQSRPSLVLSHGASRINEQFADTLLAIHNRNDSDSYSAEDQSISAECNSWLADSRKKTFLADVGIGTIDQALLSVLQSKHQSLRLLGMSRKVLVVDEVHASDPYMYKTLQTVLRFQGGLGGSAVLMSATLTETMKQDLVKAFVDGMKLQGLDVADKMFQLQKTRDYPLATVVSADGLQETAFETRPDLKRSIGAVFIHDAAAAEDLVLNTLEKGLCICWIRNTVGDALEAFKSLSAKISAEKLLLFHARFAMTDRLKIENVVLDRFGKNSRAKDESGKHDRSGRVVIATQVMEQSLDVDFDVLISDLAPIDVLLQRFGRCRRHNRDELGNMLPANEADRRGDIECYVLGPSIGGNIEKSWYSDMFRGGAKVYPNHLAIYRTAKILADKQRIQLPEDVRSLMEFVYSDEPAPLAAAELQASADKAEGESASARSHALNNLLDFKKGYAQIDGNWLDDVVVPTRLGESTTTLRLAKYIDGKVVPWCEGTAHPWELSEVKVRTSSVSAEMEFAENPTALKQAKETMPDKGQYVVTVVVKETNADNWEGYAQKTKQNRPSKSVLLQYSHQQGLSFL